MAYKQNSSREQVIDALLERMTIEEKIGQCMVIGFAGTMITPKILDDIDRYRPAGVRVTSGNMRVKNALHDPYAGGEFGKNIQRLPRGTMKDLLPGIPPPQCTNGEYCQVLNRLKQQSINGGAAIPLHATMDMEGNMSCDHPRGGIRLPPHPMGIAQSGNPEMARRTAWVCGRQLRPLGVNWMHSPVLGVNTNPNNPEIGTRSYSEDPETVIRFALEALQGFKDANVVATGKHFPGRGASSSDAHHGLPVISLTHEEMEQHLRPFKACIDAGLPSIMTAHTIYPGLGDKENPATLSKSIITDLLKDKWGFQGTVTTDAMEMGGILQRGPLEVSVLEALQAGCDLILMRDEGGSLDEIMPFLYRAAESGDLLEERLNDAVRRTLRVKYEYGILEGDNTADPEHAGDGIKDPEVGRIVEDVSRSALTLQCRDESSLLPLSPDAKVLLVEQANPLHATINSMACHPGIFWEQMLKYSANVGMVETSMEFSETDQKRVRDRLDQADVIVMTNWYFRRISHAGNSFIRELYKTGKPVIVVTNSPYPMTVSPECKNVIVTYSVAPESLKAVAEKIFS